MTGERTVSERSLIISLLIAMGGNSGVVAMGTRGQDRVVEQLDRIAETLAATKTDLASFTAAASAQLAEHSRRIEKLEGLKR